MKLKDFLDAVVANATPTSVWYTYLNRIARVADPIFREDHAVPAHTVIRFDTSFFKSESGEKYSYFNLLLRITPDHPCFRAYMRSQAIRQTCHLCYFKSPRESFDFSYCQYGPNTDLNTIVADTEKIITDRVIQFEKCIKTTDEIMDQYGLTDDIVSSFTAALDYMVEYSSHGKDHLLVRKNRNALLKDIPGAQMLPGNEAETGIPNEDC